MDFYLLTEFFAFKPNLLYPIDLIENVGMDYYLLTDLFAFKP